MKQMTYICDDGTLFYVFKSGDEVFVHTGDGENIVVGRGKTVYEAISEVKDIVNKQSTLL